MPGQSRRLRHFAQDDLHVKTQAPSDRFQLFVEVLLGKKNDKRAHQEWYRRAQQKWKEVNKAEPRMREWTPERNPIDATGEPSGLWHLVA